MAGMSATGFGPDGASDNHRYGLAALWLAFAACLATRCWYVFYNGPLDHLFSDPGRHWENGLFFRSPRFMGSIDPYAYQLWLYALRRLVEDSTFGVLAGTAVLSMALPVFWLCALRELVPLAWALAGAIVIGFVPSLFMIYVYFMNDTLMLSLSACGIWLALRAMRTHDLPTMAALVLVWTVAAYTRLIALPLAALCFVAVALPLTWRKRALLAAAIGVSFGALAVPACSHSSWNLHYCAPFGSGYLNEAYRASGARTIKILGPGDEWTYTSPSMFSEPFEPFSDWHSQRIGIKRITIDVQKGREDWQAAIDQIALGGSLLPALADRTENAVLLLFDSSWPDNNREYLWGRLNHWTRWLWLPLILGVGVLLAKTRPPLREGLIPIAGLVLIGLLLVQTSGVMEGRYRKPAEPLLIAGAFVLLHRFLAARARTAELRG